VAVVERLLAAGANPNIRTESGDTPLKVARGHAKVIELLKKAGADPKASQRFEAEVRAALKKYERPAWVPRVKGAVSTPVGSRYGGLPWLHEGEAWPQGPEGRPLAFLLQINLDALPAKALAEVGGGLLQVFFDVEDQPYKAFSPGHLVRIVLSAATRPGGVAKAPEGLTPFPEKAIVNWKQVVDRPFREAGGESYHRYPAKLPEHSDEVTFKLNVQEDKLGGWGSWVQDPEYPKVPGSKVELDRLLFQINSHRHLPVIFGDNGVGYVVRSSKSPEHVAFLWQSG
jgi:uncharacterized protein YwqG